MDKPKRKTKQEYFLSKFMRLRREFVIETQLSPERVRNNVEQLSDEKSNAENKGMFVPRYSIRASTRNESEHIYFEIIAERNGRIQQSVKAEVVILLDNDQTLVEGQVQMAAEASILIWLVTIGFTFLFLYSLNQSSWIAAPIVGLPIIGIWYLMFNDRNNLLKIIENAVHSEKAKTSI